MLNDNEKYQAQVNEGIKAEMFLAGVMDGIKAGEMVSSLAKNGAGPEEIALFLALFLEGKFAKFANDKEPAAPPKKFAMLSQPMGGKTDEEIKTTRDRAIKALTDKGYEIVNTLFTDEWYNNENMKARGVVQIPLCFLARSLENMSKCHTVYFCKGWENARGCRIEHDAAKAYGLEILYEE